MGFEEVSCPSRQGRVERGRGQCGQTPRGLSGTTQDTSGVCSKFNVVGGEILGVEGAKLD